MAFPLELLGDMLEDILDNEVELIKLLCFELFICLLVQPQVLEPERVVSRVVLQALFTDIN